MLTRVKTTPTPSFTPVLAGLLQRKCACGGSAGLKGDCEDCSKDRLKVQRSTRNSELETQSSGGVPPLVHEVLRSPGQPLDEATRAFMEPRFGHDFGRVRVHTDARAAKSASAVNALAYTVGSDVVFGAEQFAPETIEGRRLVAHELTHVVQQRGGDSVAAAATISSPTDGSEREADIAAERVTAGQSFHPALVIGPAVNRQAPPPATLAGVTATRDAFNNAGAPDAANCAAVLPAGLGVDGPAAGQNGMEMIFRINGAVPAGTEFEITRTRAAGLWERDAAGAWTRLGGNPAGTSDDHHDGDECQTPVAGRIFVIDTPGLGGSLNPTGVAFLGSGTVGAAATGAVWKLAFAEWVIARNRPLGIGWTQISSPLLHRWHSIFSVTLAGGAWTRVDTPGGQHNEIELGNIGTTGATP